MTIHSEHPFQPPEGDRDPLRRFRGHLPSPVTIWATGDGSGRSGLTISSMLVADGDPGLIIGLVDEDSDLWESLRQCRTLVVNVVGGGQGQLADAFAGLGPAPGGLFQLGSWEQSAWGPVLDGHVGWLGARLVEAEPRHVGWALLVEAVVEHVEVGDGDALSHVRGRYR